MLRTQPYRHTAAQIDCRVRQQVHRAFFSRCLAISLEEWTEPFEWLEMYYAPMLSDALDRDCLRVRVSPTRHWR